MDGDPVVGEVPRQHLPMRAEPGQEPAVAGIGLDVDVAETAAEAVAHDPLEFLEPRARAGRHGHRMRVAGQQGIAGDAVGQRVDLVERQERVLLLDAQFGEHAAHRADLLVDQRTGGIGDMEQQIGLPGLLERGAEARDQPVRQVADEADRVAQEHRSPARQPPAPCAGVERREELVFSQHVGAGE